MKFMTSEMFRLITQGRRSESKPQMHIPTKIHIHHRRVTMFILGERPKKNAFYNCF